MNKLWVVYLLKCSDETLYCGITNDLAARVLAHNNKTGAKYTRGRTPVTIFKTFSVESKSDALKLEHKIKKMSRKKKLAL